MTHTNAIKNLPLTALVLEGASLSNIVEDNELNQHLQSYATKDDLDNATNSISEKIFEDCYKKTETSSSTELNAAFADVVKYEMPTCSANGYNCFAINDSTLAKGDNCFAEGCATSATGFTAHSEGDSTEAYGDFSHTEGLYANAGEDYSHAEGIQTFADCYGGHVEGKATFAGYAVKVGELHLVSCEVAANGNYQLSDQTTEDYSTQYNSISVAWKIQLDLTDHSPGKRLADFLGVDKILLSYEGDNAEGTEKTIYGTLVGQDRTTQVEAFNFAKIPASMMWNNGVKFYCAESDTMLYGFADKQNALSVGQFFSNATPTATKVADFYVINAWLEEQGWLEPNRSTELGHAEGYGTLAHGRAAHSEGEKTRAVGSISHAEGYDTTAIGHGSRVNGVHSFAEGKYSTAAGKCVNAKGNYSIACGICNTAVDERSFTWSGESAGHNLEAYTSKGAGTFCINPANGIDGIWIGNQKLSDLIDQLVQQKVQQILANRNS